MNTACGWLSTRSTYRLAPLMAVMGITAASLGSPIRALAQDPTATTGRGFVRSVSVDSTIDILDVRDAPIRKTLEMLVDVGCRQWAINAGIRGSVTVKTGGESVRKAIDTICSFGQAPLRLSVENGVYLVQPRVDTTFWDARTSHTTQGAPTPSLQVMTSLTPPKTLRDVPRRVAAVMIVHGGPMYAILETGSQIGPNPDVRIVSCGAQFATRYPSLVPSGVPGMQDLSVTGIDSAGVTLTGADGSTIHVPLASAQSAAK